MLRIGVVIHGPAVIDSGRAGRLIEILSGMGEVHPVLGGAMGIAAVIDAGLEDLIDISRSLKPGESILALNSSCDLVLLVNEGKSIETGLAFGRLVFEGLPVLEKPLYQLEFAGGCSLIRLNNAFHPFFNELRQVLDASVVQSPPAVRGLVTENGITRRPVFGVRPGECVTVNGIVIGKALSDNIEIISSGGRITGLDGGRLKPHGIEKLEHVDLSSAIVRSGVLRDTVTTPRVLEHKASGYAVIIDHSAENTFEIAKDADMAVVVGDDTTAVAGDLLTRLGIPMIGITDGDRDGITHHAHVPPGSVVIRVSQGNDDIVGHRVREEIFGGRGRMEIGGDGFEGILDGVIGVAGGMVEEVVRY
jgi:hypothetical protein